MRTKGIKGAKAVLRSGGAVCAAFAAAASANAAEVFVSENIATSTTWTADNVYRLTKQIYVLPGATLTIEPGTLVQSPVSEAGSGSLAVCRGAMIFANGTADAPIIMTSTADDLVTYREGCNEWGNLTVMGRAYIGASYPAGNTKTPNPNNLNPMEGLVAEFPGDPRVLYGGGDDDDDSGCISYVSLRYGGRVVGLGNELNGLSLGGIGRNTEIKFVEVINNVDDGIEIWGGTVNLKNFSIWNIGDDSLDVDQGWRGKAQFGLIVQGHSCNAPQGSGVGDNAIEADGAEQSDAQPVTTAVLYNMTVIGQPLSNGGDHLTAWRDNANLQIRNSIFMDAGRNVVNLDNVDGDGGAGYGFNGTLTWAQRWQAPYNAYSTVNAPADPAAFYQAAVDGKLIEISDSVFFRNLNSSAYNEANARGVFDAGNNNVLVPGSAAADSPIAGITRGAPVVKGGKNMLPVIGLDPRARNAAATSVRTAPNDGFFTPAQYRGAFSPTENWLCGWSGVYAYGLITTPAKACIPPTEPGCTSAPACPWDLNGDGFVNGADLGLLLQNWGTYGGADLGALLQSWGVCPQ